MVNKFHRRQRGLNRLLVSSPLLSLFVAERQCFRNRGSDGFKAVDERSLVFFYLGQGRGKYIDSQLVKSRSALTLASSAFLLFENILEFLLLVQLRRKN